MKGIKKPLLSALLALLLLTGCQGPERVIDADLTKGQTQLCKDNEILSYEPVDTDKIIITIGNYMHVNTKPMVEALEERYPQIQVVTSIGNGDGYIRAKAENNELCDIVFYSKMSDMGDYFYDLSAESFTGRYNLISLNAISENDRLYQLPVASSGVGIFYNKTLFEQKGWEVPQTRDEFYALCEQIAADGIRPFAPCLKYAATVADLGMGFSNRELFGDLERAERFLKFADGEISGRGIIEPFITALQELYDRGLINDEDFSSSATQNRLSMYEGTTAMVVYALNLVSFYDDEQPDCELGFMGFPTDEPGEHYLPMSHDDACMSLSAHSMEDPEKREILLDIFDFFSTDEGQDLLFQGFSGVSSVKSYQSNITTRFEATTDCIDHGRMYYPRLFWNNDNLDEIQQIVSGQMTMEEAVAAIDQMAARQASPEDEAPVIFTAAEDFSALETGCFMADAFRQTTGAEIALVPYMTFFKGVLMKTYEGEHTNADMFYLRGTGGGNCLSVYQITGKSLRELLERPYINGDEVNATYAVSGLKMTYAPWAEEGSNVIELTLADGTPIDDDRLYTVAAWDSTVDGRYISSLTETYEEVNNTVTYMEQITAEMRTISPPKDNRITLDWETRASGE